MKLYFPSGMTHHGENAIKHLDFEQYTGEDHKEPAMFWCYFLEDYEYMLEHKGKKFIFWHGSDVLRLRENPELRKYLRPMHEQDITHVCHSQLLQDELAELGLYALVRPTFWGDVKKYKPTYEYSDKPEIYLTSSPGREIEYGEGYVIALSKAFPECRFHVYGNDGHSTDNLFFHGRVPEDQMDKEIVDMQICLRMNKHDGFSQTSMKALLLGQYLITRIDYDYIHYAEKYQEIVHLIDCYIDNDTMTDDYYDPENTTKQFNNFDYI